MSSSPILKKPKLEQNTVTGATETAGESGHEGSATSNNDDSGINSREEQEEALVALIEHRVKEVEHLRKRVSYYKSQLEQAEERLHGSESKLARIRRVDNVSSSKNISENGAKKVKVEIIEESFKSPPQSRPELLIPSRNHRISQPIKVAEQPIRLEDSSTKGSAASAVRASPSVSRHSHSNGNVDKKKRTQRVDTLDTWPLFWMLNPLPGKLSHL